MTYNDAENFPIDFTMDNTIIIGRSGSMKEVADQELEKLNSEGNTVFITDPYLFSSHGDTNYEVDIQELLKELKANEIHYCVKEISNQNLFSNIKLYLESVGCLLKHDVLDTDCHDRFWLCKETNKAVVFGTSLNGLCKRICRISELNEEEISELKQVLVNEGITI